MRLDLAPIDQNVLAACNHILIAGADGARRWVVEGELRKLAARLPSAVAPLNGYLARVPRRHVDGRAYGAYAAGLELGLGLGLGLGRLGLGLRLGLGPGLG